MKGLVTRNTHVQYERPITSGKKVMAKFLFTHHTRTPTQVGAGQNVPMPKRTQPKRTQFWSKRTHFLGQNVPSPPKRTQPFGQNVPNIFFF